MTAAAVGGTQAAVRDTGVRVVVSTRADGDFHLDDSPEPVLDVRRRALVDLPWTQLDEVHGSAVHVVDVPGARHREVGDALVSTVAGAVLGVWVGDCAPVVLAGDGVIGAAHAGWRGVEAGVLQATVEAMRSLGARSVVAGLGPCIGPCCYEFGDDDLDRLAGHLGPGVRSVTRNGRAALDVPAAVRAALAQVDVPLVAWSGLAHGCTGCESTRWFSHRVRGERSRQIVGIWREP